MDTGWKDNMQIEVRSKAAMKRALILTLYALISFFFDIKNFGFVDSSSYRLYAVLKVVQLFLVWIILGKGEKVWKTKSLDHKSRLAIKLFGLFSIGILLLWPGNWVEVDEFSVYQAALVLKVHFNQGLFSTAIHILGLMFFFHRGAVVLFQCVLAAWIYAEVISECEAMTGKKAIPLYVLFFSPVALYFLYQPMRTFLFGALILLFLQRYILLWNESVEERTPKQILQLTVLIAGIMCIRTEFKFMIIGYPLMLIFLLKHWGKTCFKPLLKALLIIVVILAGYTSLEKSGSGGGSPLSQSFVMPDYTIFKDPKFDWESNRAEVEAIDRVYNIDDILTKTNRSYTLAMPRDGHTPEEMSGFLKASIRLISRYPQDYLICRWNVFLISVGFDRESGYIQTTEHIQYIDPNTITQKPIPLNEKLQNRVSKFLGGQFTIFGIKMYFVFWALWIPIVLTIELFLISVMERRFDFSLAILVLLGELFCAILTAPVKYAMYYFANYLAGWYILYFYCSYRNYLKRDQSNVNRQYKEKTSIESDK